MNLSIRPMSDDDLEAIVALSLLAWAPVFHSFEQLLGSEIYSLIYPDWHKSQSEGVTSVCQDEKMNVWVAKVDNLVVGFIAYILDHDKKEGEVYMLAVHPDYQNQEIGVTTKTRRVWLPRYCPFQQIKPFGSLGSVSSYGAREN